MYIFGVLKNLHLFFYKPYFIFVLLITVSLALGFWQIDRLEWKNTLIKNFNNLKNTQAKNIEEVNIKEFVKIRIEGKINRSKKIFLPAKTLNGKVGMRIASELTSNNGKKYLVDEGWFENKNYKFLKNNNDIINDSVLGYVRFPRNAKFFTPQNNPSSNEWYTYDLKQISQFIKSDINTKYFIKKMNDNKESYLLPSSNNFQHRNNHLEYAITWFCMSFSFLILFLVYLKKNNK